MQAALVSLLILLVAVITGTAMATTQTFWSSRVDGLGWRLDPSSNLSRGLFAQVAIHRQTLAKSISYAISADKDWCILCTSGVGGITITLPTAVGYSGADFLIKKVDSGAGAVTIATTSAQTIDGGVASAQNLAAQWNFLRVVSDGANWIKIN